jgi:hypothetical protein
MEQRSIKVVETPWVVYSLTTHQGKAEVDGKEIEFRFSEDDNGAQLYVLTDGGWNEIEYDEDSPEYVVFQACLQWPPSDFGKPGEIIEIEDEF